jgi:DNA-binding CsgD family transcriptional regulator
VTPVGLLERTAELAELQAAFADAHSARGRVVLVEAPAGLGKTSLLAEARVQASAAGFAVLWARASELEHDFAYGCVRQLLEPTVVGASRAERDRLFAAAAVHARPVFDPSAPLTPASSAGGPFAVLHGLYWMLNNLSDDRPTVLMIDDVQWADAESLRFLAYLGPRVDGLPVVVLVARRTGEGATADLARLALAPETTVLRPAPLSADATAELCAARLGSAVAPEFAAACERATGGNPYYLEALLRAAKDSRLSTDVEGARHVPRVGPASVADAVLLRISAAHPQAPALVRAVAVLGDGTGLTEAAQLAGIPVEAAADAADLLVAQAILAAPRGLEFAHPIVREAVYGDLGPRHRAVEHGRAARILAAAGASNERVAAQIVQAEPVGDDARVAFLRRVAGADLTRGAPAAAVAWLRRALAEPPPSGERGAVLLELGIAEHRLGLPSAIDHLAAATELIEDAALRVQAVRQLANALTLSGRSDAAVAALEAAIPAVESSHRELALLLEADLAAHSRQAIPDVRARVARRLARLVDVGRDSPGARLVQASRAFDRARSSESAADAVAHLEGALADGRLLAEQEFDVPGPFYHLVIGLLATDALDLAAGCVAQALQIAQAQASIPAVAFLTACRARIALRRGEVAQAEADGRTAVELPRAHGIRSGRTFGGAIFVDALTETGDIEAAERVLQGAGPAHLTFGLTNNELFRARSLLRLAQGRTSEGLTDLIEFGRRDELCGGANPLASRWRSRAALALAELGDWAEARRMAADDLARARRWGASSGIGTALRAAALVGDGSDAIELLTQATQTLEKSPDRLEHARALTDLGAALRRANHRVEARGPLRDGLRLAQRCSAGPLVERARTELRAAGGRSAAPTGRGAAQLTVSERRVAELAAQGMSNKEIAQTLFVTSKTVETHLGRAYLKLNIVRRTQLGRALAAGAGSA